MTLNEIINLENVKSLRMAPDTSNINLKTAKALTPTYKYPLNIY